MTEPMKTAEFAKLKYQVGEILCRKFLEYNDGKFHTGIELNPATHALTEFVEEQVAAERERIKSYLKSELNETYDGYRHSTLSKVFELIDSL